MSDIKYGGAGEIPPAKVNCPGDVFENCIRELGVISACEWFGHHADSAFTAEIIELLRERSKHEDEETQIENEAAANSKGDWVYELSSGFDGFRCRECGTWIYANTEYKCECDE